MAIRFIGSFLKAQHTEAKHRTLQATSDPSWAPLRDRPMCANTLRTKPLGAGRRPISGGTRRANSRGSVTIFAARRDYRGGLSDPVSPLRAETISVTATIRRHTIMKTAPGLCAA